MLIVFLLLLVLITKITTTIKISTMTMSTTPAPTAPPAAASTGNSASVGTSVVMSVPEVCIVLISGTLVSVVDCAGDLLGLSTRNVVSVPRILPVRAVNSDICVSESRDTDCPRELVNS